MQVELRPADPKDAARLSHIAFHSKAWWGYPPEFMESCVDELRVTVQDINNPDLSYFIAGRDDEIQGFYALVKLGGWDYELEALFVSPGWIGEGVGRTLMEHAKQRVIELGGKCLKIQGDPHAEAFYKAADARRIGERESASIRGRMLPLFEIRFDHQPVTE